MLDSVAARWCQCDSAKNAFGKSPVCLPSVTFVLATRPCSQLSPFTATAYPVHVKRLVLVADEDSTVLPLVSSHLTAAGLILLEGRTGTTALSLTRKHHPALVVLSLTLSEMSGFEVCRALRTEPDTSKIPIVMLSATTSEIDRVVAFEVGADDYIAKPLNPRELVLRVLSILGRTSTGSSQSLILEAGMIRMDPERHETTVAGRAVALTAIEFRLLSALLQYRQRVMSRDALLSLVWGAEHNVDPRAVDTHCRRLRAKLGAAGGQIRTVRQFGYRIEDT